jgi:transketolase
MDPKVKDLELLSKRLREEIIEISYHTGKKGVHIGPALSCADILAVLYGGIMSYRVNEPSWEDRDRFILSKGHAYAALYSILSLSGYCTHEYLMENFMATEGGRFPVHPVKDLEMGIETSSGSLGMGLGYAVGKAIAAKRKNQKHQIYVLCGDGECNEGSIWEAVFSAAQYHLDNLTLFVDHNKYQQDGMTQSLMHIGFVKMFEAAGWNVRDVDGHNVQQLYESLKKEPHNGGKPTVYVCHTVKGKGISFMEGDNSWHHASMSEEQYNQAINELKD